MGNDLFDVFTIGADEAAWRHIVILQPDTKAQTKVPFYRKDRLGSLLYASGSRFDRIHIRSEVFAIRPYALVWA